MNDDSSLFARIIPLILAALIFAWFIRQRKADLEPRVLAVLGQHGAMTAAALRTRMGETEVGHGDLKLVLDALVREGSVVVQAGGDGGEEPRYGLPKEGAAVSA